MSDRPDLARDEALVRRIAESYRPPEPAPSARAAFRAGIDARIRRRATQRWSAAAATICAALAFVLLRGSPAPIAPSTDLRDDAALLALALPDESEDETLPADYQAIDDLLIEGEGV
jgi:hypothetical protein